MRFVPTVIPVSLAVLVACAPATTASVATAPQPSASAVDTASIRTLVGKLDL